MSESTYDRAMEAFGAVEEPNQPESTDAPENNVAADQQAQPVPNASGEGAAQEQGAESVASADIDLSDLPEEAQIFLRARQREMEQGMHAKFREANELRTQAESAIQFVEALNADPNFAYQVFNRLQQGLVQSGYLAQEGQSDPDEYYGQPEFEDYAAGDDPYADRIAQLEAAQNAMIQQIQAERLSAQLENQLAQVRSANPDWDDSDIQAVVDRGFVTNGDLLKAAELYRAENDRILARYIKQKSSVKAPPRVEASAQGSAAPSPLTGLDEAQRRQLILDRLMAGGE